MEQAVNNNDMAKFGPYIDYYHNNYMQAAIDYEARA